ncbi:unnamed protein product [Cuscuta epithymum]|uniref:ENTH domain-containing protein n=1 Tax=Cuscuta epithymum TaxID=186058 RepID=A0AAV0F4R6_9ASTE|nr:unnamed protein product [Cuscuta epithymum]
MPSKLKKAISAVKDQTSISIAKVASNNSSSSNLEVAVLKATTHDDDPVDTRYIRELLHLVSADKVYASACARAIGKRIGRTRNWIVTLKSLLLVLRIFQDGDPYFPREVLHAMKRGARILNLSGFRDASHSSPWDFTAFVRTFALYLDERLDCFLTGKLQRRFTQSSLGFRGRRPDEPVREMKPTMLLDRIGHWQRLLERAIGTRPTGAAKANRLVQIALYAVVEESFDLYRDITDGLAIIIDGFSKLEHQSGVIAFQTCLRAARQCDELAEFYGVCKSLGVGRTSEYPCIQRFSGELIESLQQYLKDNSSFQKNHTPSFLLPPKPTSSRASHGGQSELSAATDGSSETGSVATSLEDLLCATLTTAGKNPAISIDLEAYSHRDEKNFKLSESGSTKSLPASNSFADLLSLDDWDEDGETRPAEETAPATNNAGTDSEQSNGAMGWELVLFETPPQEAAPAGGNNFEGLFGGPVSSSLPPHHHYYNPFLQDELFPTFPNGTQYPSPDMFALVPAFQETPPTYSSPPLWTNAASFPGIQDQYSPAPTFRATAPAFPGGGPTGTGSTQNDENDPFASLLNDEMFGGSNSRGRNLVQEQQLWLHNQNKIIAKHLS